MKIGNLKSNTLLKREKKEIMKEFPKLPKKKDEKMVKLFKEQEVSLYQVAKDLNLPMVKLYRYAEKKIDIDKMPTKLILDLANYFHIEVNKFYKSMVKYLKG